MLDIDAIDFEIIKILKENSRMTSSDISKIIHLSIPSVSERIRKLERTGVIDYFTVKLSRAHLGHNCVAYVFIQLQDSDDIPSFRESMIHSPQVLECHHISGEYDYLLKVGLNQLHELENFITNTLKSNHHVVRSNTIFILSTLKEE